MASWKQLSFNNGTLPVCDVLICDIIPCTWCHSLHLQLCVRFLPQFLLSLSAPAPRELGPDTQPRKSLVWDNLWTNSVIFYAHTLLFYQALGVGLRGRVKSAAEIWRTIARAGNDVTSREWRHSWGRHTGGTSHCWKTIVSMTSCQCRALFYVMYPLPWRYEYSWCATLAVRTVGVANVRPLNWNNLEQIHSPFQSHHDNVGW